MRQHRPAEGILRPAFRDHVLVEEDPATAIERLLQMAG
jgi:hypothetical protein